jgi:MoaA/NifB/PqqE/SkfB family radical SAM enzyme
MKREDIFDVISDAVSLGLSTAITPSATPLVTRAALTRMKEAGLGRFAVSLDGVDAATHDAFRGVPGSYNRTFEIMEDARDVGLTLQINTTITRRNVDQVEKMADMVAKMGIVLWSVFFLIPVGRGMAEERILPEQYEEVFEKLFVESKRQPYSIKTTEAPQYRRFVLLRDGDPQLQPGTMPLGRIQRAPLGVSDGKGTLFVSHTGRVFPTGFLPMGCGQYPADSIVDVYQNSPLFQQLRNPDLFHGKCGICEFRQVCGGSRARAYALTQDPLGSDTDCIFQPSALGENVCLA